MRCIAGILVLAAVAAAQGKADTPEQAAGKALAAFQASDHAALRALAQKDDPDPWLVADDLCFRGEHDAAEAFSKAAPRYDTEKLPEYVAAQRERKPDGATRAALTAANKALADRKPEEALAAIDGVPKNRPDVVSVRLLYGRGLALRALQRLEESARAFSAAADAAERIGGHARAALALYQCGSSCFHRSDLRGALAAAERQLRVETARGNRPLMAKTLTNMGMVHERLRDYPPALGYHEKALSLVEELGDRVGMARACRNIGRVCSLLGRSPQALEYQEKALELLQAVGDRKAVAGAHINRGHTLSDLGRLAEAVESYEKGLTEARAAGYRPWVANALGGLGLAHRSLGKYARALEYQEQALGLHEELGDRRAVAGAHINLGHTLADLGRFDEALRSYERGLMGARAAGYRPWIANALEGLGYVYQSRGEYPRALEHQVQAHELREALGDRAGVASSLRCIGGLHDDLGDAARALEYLERALELDEELGNRVGMARALTNIGVIHFNLGDHARALDSHDKALRLQEALEIPADVATSLGNLGITHWRLGDFARALEYCEEALERFEELGDPAGLAKALGNLGRVHKDLGDFEKALEYQGRALRIGEELELRPDVATALGSMGSIHCGLDDLPRALEYYEKSLELHEELGNRSGVAAMLIDIGRVHARLGRPAEALESYEKGMEAAEALRHRPWTAVALGCIGSIHANGKDYPRARDYYEKSLELMEELGDRSGMALILGNLGKLHYELGDDPKALRNARRAIEQLPFLLGGLSGDLSASGADTWTWLIDTGVRAGMRLGEPAEVAYFIESVRAGELRESLGGRDALRRADLPASLLESEQEARAAVGRARTLLARLESKGDLKEIRAARDARDEAEAAFLEIVARIQREAKAVADVVHPKAAPLAEIQRALRSNEVLVSYALLYEEAVALVLHRDEARVVELGTRRELEELASALSWAVAGEEWKEGAAEARRALLDPLGLPEQVKRLLIAPDGSLAYVPFAVLAGEREVALVPSGTTYGVLLEERAKRGEKVLAVGDPDYGVEPDPRPVTLMRSGAELGSLPGTQTEVRAVGDVTLLDKRATETTLTSALGEVERWRAVHLACHGLIRTDQPRLSSLALTPDEHNDGYLTVLEVFRMKVPADLVVLSACETAKGKIYRAEGVIGFTRAFMMAGAPRVIVSLWKVDDEATRALMVKFYELWNPKDGSKGLPTATALKRAQEYVAGHEKWKHPYYWAAWQLWGLPE